jgi:hypothetical protein
VSFHTYIPNFYIGENNFFYSGLNEGCDISAVAVTEIPSPTTTTTTTVIYYCNLSGTAVVTQSPCILQGTAACTNCTTTTTSTTTTIFVQRYVYTVNRYICDTEFPNDCAASYVETLQVADTHNNLNVGEPGNYWFYLDEVNSYLFEVISYDGPLAGEPLLLTNMIGGTKNCNVHCPLPV